MLPPRLPFRSSSIPESLRRAVALLLGTAALATAQPLDTVVFGDAGSEEGHQVKPASAKVIVGGLGQPARKIFADPADPKQEEGGYIDATMKCDPLAENYVTLKLWGSDFSQNSGGAILLYLLEEGQMYQVGFRDIQAGEYSPLAWGGVEAAPIPHRFYYSTIPLPLSMTQGRTSVTLRIVGTGVGPLGSPGIYRAYVHQGSYFVPAPADPQSPAPAPAPLRPAGPLTMEEMVAVNAEVENAQVKEWLAKGEGDAAVLLRALQDETSPAHRNPAALRIVANEFTRKIDETTRKYFKNPDDAGGAWGGAYGNEGMMIADLGAANFGRRLEEVVDLGDPAGPAKRRVLWGRMLKASRDSGRFNRQGPTSAQSMLGDKEIYRANRGLQTLGSADAIPEPQAMRYLLEAAGLEPWRGSDLREGGSAFPMGTNYYEVSPAGLTKENGYVSAYGEVYDVVSGYYEMSRDPRLRPQLLKLLRARSFLRYPMVDADGYRVFQMVGPLDWRSHQTFPIDWAYGERKNRLSVAQATNDPMAVGFAKQLFADNQGGEQASRQMLAWKDSGIRLPMTEGQPDFAWADVDNGLVAIKRGEELTWIEPYWQTRGGIHNTGRAMQITPTDARVAHIRISTQFDWTGKWRAQGVGVGWEDRPFESFLGPVQQAYFNDKYLESQAPDYAPGSRREEFIGRASFYAVRYGRYLVGINMDRTRSFVLQTPKGFTSAPDLITKTPKAGPVTVAPFSAVVLDLGTNVEVDPVPLSPRLISANGIPNGIGVMWNTVGGATTYTLRRATNPGGPYVTIATGIGAVYPRKWGEWPYGSYVDTAAAPGTTYFYRVSGVNANGESYSSPVSPGATRAATSVSRLPLPWANINFKSASGATTFADGTFTLSGGTSGNIGDGADTAQFVYHPLAGDGTLTVRLAALNGATKAGLIVRKTLTANSPFAGLLAVPGGVRPVKRDQFDENLEGMPGDANDLPNPVWLRLQRIGLTYTSWHAPDVNGAPGTWRAASSFKIDDGMDGMTYLGMIADGGKPVFDHVEVTPFGPAVPAAPPGLTATTDNGSVTLSWLPTDRAATYTVKGSLKPGGPYPTTIAANLSTLTHSVEGLPNARPCHFVVVATNSTGSGPESAAVSATPVATAAPPTNLAITPRGTQATLTWTASKDATAYAIRRSVDGVCWKELAAKIPETTFTDTGLTPGQGYNYSVQAINALGASAPALIVGVPAPAAPHLHQADATDAGAKLVWSAATEATSYDVWRANSAQGTYAKVATGVASPTFTDQGLTKGADGFYRVTAVNAAGASEPSNILKAGWGTGLLGEYFNSQDFSGDVKFTRVDPHITMNWGQGPPAPGMNREFSVRWTGQLEPPVTGAFTFSGSADDSIQAFIDGKQVVGGEPIELVADKKYDFRVEFIDREGAAFFKLTWEGPGIPRQNLPASRLYPAKR